jgi:electron transport complex protein RnfC
VSFLSSVLEVVTGGGGFRHGVHPPDHKGYSADQAIRRMPFPERVVLPLRQHAGAPARCIVEPGQRVERGDRIGEAQGFISVPIHASVAGTVEEVAFHPHPDGSQAEAVVIRTDPGSAQIPRPRIVPRWEELDADGVRRAVQDAGVVGLGGAAFPTHVKLQPPEGLDVEFLLVNGAECEPYLTSDHRVMVEHPERVHFGIRIMMQCLGASRCVIGVEENKPDAVARLRDTLPADLDVAVRPLRVKYPQGAEKMLIHAVTGREVPSGKLPIHVGTVVQNVGSIAAIAEVFETGYPLIERIVTVTGPGIARPSNLIVPVGTPLREVLAFCGGLTPDAREVLAGGPMMGQPQADLDAPILKGTSGIVVLTEAEAKPTLVHPCISCGHCLDACPVFLNPTLLGKHAQAGRYDEMLEHHLMDCMLCGSCSYVCPSNIPLSQMFALAKGQIRREQRRERERQAAEEEAARDAEEVAAKGGGATAARAGGGSGSPAGEAA